MRFSHLTFAALFALAFSTAAVAATYVPAWWLHGADPAGGGHK